ncbi:golgin subfamily A member 8N-like isoform X2 [Saimiri boliviensis]|uniref:golgin subfamily A member 8N-like isoform X2 n=1 Tax=Saimiri boliviensis TaxID=27679 RepID=UPI003D77269E
MAGEIEIFKMEKSQDAMKIEELKRSLAHLQNHLAEPSILKPPAGHSDLEKNLKTETKYLRDELREQERLQEAKMRLREQENENRSALHLEQEGKELQEKLDEQETVISVPSGRAGRQAPASGEGRCKATGSSTLGQVTPHPPGQSCDRFWLPAL